MSNIGSRFPNRSGSGWVETVLVVSKDRDRKREEERAGDEGRKREGDSKCRRKKLLTAISITYAV